MKIKCLLFIGCFFIFTALAAQKVLSLHPLFTEQTAVLVPGIEGTWYITQFEQAIRFEKAGDNFYQLTYGSETNPSLFEAVFVRIGEQLFLDLQGSLPDTLGESDYRDGFLSGHSVYKLSMHKDTLHLSDASYSWFYKYSVKNNTAFKYEWVQPGMLLTLNTDSLIAFIKEHGSEPGIFKDYLGAINREPAGIKKERVIQNVPGVSYANGLSQSCLPAFPLKDGWLGADGDVSVPLNPTTSLFIFSDTYVGNQSQQSRKGPGTTMVSNTAAVQTCLPDGSTAIKYYWGKMYTDHPEPLFKSFTRRYNFWVVNAFMIKGSLYVVLQKVAPGIGVAPDNIFSFALLGFTLAKVSNPASPPNEWEIEYLLLPGFSNPFMAIGPSIKLDNYIYFFVSREDKAQLLVRNQFDIIDDPGKPFEYYALDRSWKEGLNTSDMETVVKGFRSNTVNYHPDLQLWVMICDLKFMDNKILMRTAKKLTGPWSDEIPVYKIPELTPGNAAYHQTNFCYLARECIQYYDPKKKEMLLTYDINNSDFGEIVSNERIYTPKLIRVSLKRLN